ncbi:MAG: PA14 domain-containing protein, partial [Sulfitobacter sp.]
MSLFAEYFVLPSAVSSLSEIDFDKKPDATSTVHMLNMLNGHDAFWNGGAQDLFAARYTGNLNITKPGSYTLFLTSDDGSALSLDGTRVIGNDGLHGTDERRVTLDLDAGAHDIEILYFERDGEQTLALDWAGPDSNGARVPVSGASLSHGDATDHGDHGDHGDHDDGNDDAGNDTGDHGDHDTATGAGLRAEYFALQTGVSRLREINFDADPTATGTATVLNMLGGHEAFWEGGAQDNFAARYTGNLNVKAAGEYTLYLTSDDGSAVYINGVRVINNDGLHGTDERRVTLDLDAGAHDIEIRYFERGGEQTLALDWAGPDSNGTRVSITGASLSHGDAADHGDHDDTGDDTGDHGDHDDHGDDTGGDTASGPGLQAQYFALGTGVSRLSQIDFDADPTATGTASVLNMLGGSEAFWEGGAQDNFAARYTGNLNVKAAGEYTLYLRSDDGSAVYIDGVRVINNDGLHGTIERQITLDLDAGAHDIEVRYFERGGLQTLALDWAGPDSNGTRVSISGASLSHGDFMDHGDHDDTGDDTGDHGDHDDGTDDTDDDTTDHGDHDDHDGGPITPPLTPAEADAFVAAVMAQGETHAHGDDSGKATEHMALLELVPRSDATHVAIGDGDWFDASTWHQGRIPGDGAQVLIPDGISVNYDGESDASLFTVRVDGELSFATDADTRLEVDTLIVSPTGRLEIGTEDNPVQAGVNAEIVIANNGNIDTNWDPTLVSRGVISHGEVEIHGAEKTSHIAVDDAPMRGDTQIDLSELPDGWQVGDTLVLTGTHKQGWTWDNNQRRVVHVESEDEEVTITAINGTTVTIDRPLAYDHDAPRDDLSAYVANMSRNITVSSEDGENTATHQRGHVMFMHSDDVDVRYAAFDDLGRTDKSEAAFDVGTLASVQSDSNVKGRYAFHFHKTGTEDQEAPAIAIGNTVSGSPGWGFVQHSSQANFTQNVAFDVFGAAFAAENGDETGIWSQNLAIRAEGIGYGEAAVKQLEDLPRHDNGRTGDGFFFAGRLVEASDNIAANTTHGYVWMTRSAPNGPLSDNLNQPEVAYGADGIRPNQAPINTFSNNEAFGTQVGIIVVKANPAQNHDVRTVMEGFTNWETSAGVDLGYTSHYTLIDFDLLGTENNAPVASAESGYTLGSNTFDIVANGFNIEGFNTGVNLNFQNFTFGVSGSDVDN